ncbi:MBG domain-containing protein, partial [Algoriphagus sp.]|uniref:MBG domain-containing protein n=1 Tax=Algoriphagus sp. TaxID=1872435 RepID=UPI0026090971
FEDESFVFDGTEKSLAITGTLPSGTEVAYSNNGRTNVGTQIVTSTISGNNFTDLILTAELEITPAGVEGITFEDESFVFDGSEKFLVITGDLPAGTSVAYTNNVRTNVGSQEVTATISGSNFETLVLTADLTITPSEVEGITFEDESFVFDGTEKSLAITGTLPSGTEVAYSNNGRTNVGTQIVTSTISGNNFTDLILTAELEITPAGVEGITFEDESFVFDGSEKFLVITGDLPAGTSVAYTNNVRTNVGSQEVTATISGSNFETLVLTADLTITLAEVEGITFEDESFVFDGTEKSLAITGDLPEETSVEYSNNSRIDVGLQTVTATITGGNYEELLLTAELTITPATLSITAEANQSKTYGDADPTFSYQASGFKNGDGESILTGALARVVGENVGSYAINLGSLSAGANYTINYTGADFAITERTLTVIADPNQGKVYGEADPTLTYTASNFGNGEDESILSGVLARTAGENVGSYAISLGSLSAGDNYTIDFTGADFAITPATLNITADANQSKTYGDEDPIFTYTATGFKNGDD